LDVPGNRIHTHTNCLPTTEERTPHAVVMPNLRMSTAWFFGFGTMSKTKLKKLNDKSVHGHAILAILRTMITKVEKRNDQKRSAFIIDLVF
jgi:hypothetical protein